MSKNIVINEKTYNGVSTVNFNTPEGSIAVYKDTDEMTSGSFDIPTEMTLLGINGDTDSLLSDFFLSHKLEVKSGEMIVLKIDSDTPPSQGSYTLRTMIIAFSDKETANGNPTAVMAFTSGSQNSLIAPNIYKETKEANFNCNTAYITLNTSTGYLTFNASINKMYIPANASVYYAKYPFNYSTGLMHE